MDYRCHGNGHAYFSLKMPFLHKNQEVWSVHIVVTTKITVLIIIHIVNMRKID